MDILFRLKEVRRKFYREKPCPTPVLMYLATGRVYHSGVQPWYDSIRELAFGVDRNAAQFHGAVIFRMYPELKESSIKLGDVADKFLDE